MAARWETVFVQSYGRLVRAAYVVDAGHSSRQARWSRAHRLVQRSLPLRAGRRIAAEAEDGYSSLLARVLNRSLRRRFPWPGSFNRLTRAATPPGGPEHAAVDYALARVDPQARAAYLLIIAEGMNRKSATAVLQVAGAPDPYAAVTGACRLRDQLAAEHGLDVARQTELLDDPAMNPISARVQVPAPALLRTIRISRGALSVLAGVLVLAGAATLVTGVWSGPAERSPAVRLVSGEVWRTSALPILASWPSRGEARTDRKLTDAAVTAWRDNVNVRVGKGTDSTPPVGAPQVLFAGRVDGAQVVLLADPARLARYTVSGKDDPIVELSPMPGSGVAGASAVRLRGSRYLLAPWVKQVQVGTIGGEWQALAARDGVTDAASPVPGSCYTGPVLRLTAQDIGPTPPVTVADLGQIGLVRITEGDPKSPGALSGDWGGLGCQLAEWRDTAVVAVHAWQFWSGQLPGGGGLGRWTCMRADLADGDNQVRAVLIGTTANSTAMLKGTRMCSGLGGPVAAGTWWKAPSGSWYVLAAGSSGIERLDVAVESTKAAARAYVAVGPMPAPVPIMIKAREVSGSEIPVLGVIGG